MALNIIHPQKMPVWVKLWGVPMEFLHKEGVSYAVSAIGKPLQVDVVTATNSRIRYVRASVEMEADGEFVKEFDMECADGSVCRVDVEYHILPPRCSKCRVFGHSDAKCQGSEKSGVLSVHASGSPPVDVGKDVEIQASYSQECAGRGEGVFIRDGDAKEICTHVPVSQGRGKWKKVVVTTDSSDSSLGLQGLPDVSLSDTPVMAHALPNPHNITGKCCVNPVNSGEVSSSTPMESSRVSDTTLDSPKTARPIDLIPLEPSQDTLCSLEGKKKKSKKRRDREKRAKEVVEGDAIATQPSC